MPDDSINGKLALITGGSRGIGFAAARELGALGATVVLVSENASRASAAASALVEEGIDAVGAAANVADGASMDALAASLGSLASPDILVISAGVMSEKMAKTLRTSDEEWRRVMSVNLDGAFHAIRCFAPGMVQRRSGRVIAVSACLGRFTGPGTAGGLAPYRVSKAALNALVKNFAAETGNGARGVFVDAMCPNHCRTDMGGPDAPRSAEEGARTITWLATRNDGPTGFLWEDEHIVPW